MIRKTYAILGHNEGNDSYEYLESGHVSIAHALNAVRQYTALYPKLRFVIVPTRMASDLYDRACFEFREISEYNEVDHGDFENLYSKIMKEMVG